MDTFDMFDAFEPFQQNDQQNNDYIQEDFPERTNYHQNPFEQQQYDSNENQAIDIYSDMEDFQQQKLPNKNKNIRYKKEQKEQYIDPQQGYQDSDLLLGTNFSKYYEESDPQRNYLINQENYYKVNNRFDSQNRPTKALRQFDSQPHRQNIIQRNLKYQNKNVPNKSLEKKAKQKYLQQNQRKYINSNKEEIDKTGIYDMLDYSMDLQNNVDLSESRQYKGVDILKKQVEQTPKSLNYSYYSQKNRDMSASTPKIKKFNNKPYKVKHNLNRSLSQNSQMERSAYVTTAYNEEDLIEKMELGKKQFGDKKKKKRREIPQVRKTSINSDGQVDLVGQKYLISAFMQLSKEYKELSNKYVGFRRECLITLENRDQGGMIGYQEISQQISYLSQDLLQLIQQGIPAPYPQRIKRCVRQLDSYQKEMGWFLVVQEAQQYFSVEFYQTIMTYESQKSLDVLLDLLNKNNIKYQGLLDQMVFEYKQGYTLYNTMSLLVESIKVWLRIYFYYKSFLDIFNVYLTYSNFKKIIKSNQVHENFIKIEYQFQQILSNKELPSYYRMQSQTSLVELKEIKQQYYQYYVEFKTEKKYGIAKEMYDMVKDMKKYLNNYNENYENENRRGGLRKICEQIIRDSNQIYKKVNIIIKKNQSTPTIDRLLNKFLHKYEVIENTLITLRPNTKLGPKEFTHY